MRMPANDFRENDLLLFDHLVEINLLVLDKVDGRCALGYDAAEGCGHVGEVTIEGLDVERAESGVDVVRREGCAMGMAREARRFLGKNGLSANMRAFESTKLETRHEDVLARPGVYDIPRRLPAFLRFRPEGCLFQYSLLLPVTRTKANTSVNKRPMHD